MVEVCDVTKTYRRGDQSVAAVGGATCQADEGELLVIHGPSGSGKSTLLLLIGGMLPPDSGTIRYNGEDVYAWSASQRNAYRKRTVGFVFQRFFLMPYLTVYDNIRVPLALGGQRDGVEATICGLARRLRIEDRLGHKPAELSVGEQQRAAVARALAGDKKLILADEPTGNLDVANVEIMADCFREEARRGRTVLLVTHNPSLLDVGTRRFRLEAGRLVEE